MSWGFSFVAESKEAAKKEVDAQQYVPETFKEYLKGFIDLAADGPAYKDPNSTYKLFVESNGHHDTGVGNGSYRITWMKVVS